MLLFSGFSFSVLGFGVLSATFIVSISVVAMIIVIEAAYRYSISSRGSCSSACSGPRSSRSSHSSSHRSRRRRGTELMMYYVWYIVVSDSRL